MIEDLSVLNLLIGILGTGWIFTTIMLAVAVVARNSWKFRAEEADKAIQREKVWRDGADKDWTKDRQYREAAEKENLKLRLTVDAVRKALTS